MTGEEAIRCLSVHSSTNGSGLCTDEQHYKAKQMAIQALSQEPTDDKCHYCEHNFTPYQGNTGEFTEQEPCDDAISRKLAIRAIKNLYPDIPRVDFNGAKRKWADKYAQYIECERLIEQLPPVTQKSGKWIDHSYEEGYVECPFCGHATNCEDNIDELHYCFYCGAKMESEG